MDAPRDFLIFIYLFIFSPNEQRAGRGGGGALPNFFERDWPPCKVVFFGLATNALNVRNNNNNNNNNCMEYCMEYCMKYCMKYCMNLKPQGWRPRSQIKI